MTKAKILIVEDEAIIAMEIENQLQSLGYQVTSLVDTGEKAIKKAEEDKPDLILMDIILDNDDDGIETANKILAFTDVPIVYLTAQEDDAVFERAKITKPFGYLLKPFNDRDLNLVVETATYRQDQKIKLDRALEDARSIINSSFVLIISLNREDRIVEYNQAAEWELGYSRDEVIGKSILNFLSHKEDLVFIKDNIARGKRCQLDIEFIHQNGKNLNCLLSLSLLKDSYDNNNGILMISH